MRRVRLNETPVAILHVKLCSMRKISAPCSKIDLDCLLSSSENRSIIKPSPEIVGGGSAVMMRSLWFTQLWFGRKLLCCTVPLFSQSSQPCGGGIEVSRGSFFSTYSVTCCR